MYAIICVQKKQDALENAGLVADFQGSLEMLPAGWFFYSCETPRPEQL